MIGTDSLAKPELFTQKISVVIADIDYTLMDFAIAQQAAIDALASKYGNEFSSTVNDIFMLINEEHQHKDSNTWDRKIDFEKIINEITEIEKPSLEQYGLKRWSRESWMIIASRQLKMNFAKADVEECREIYWKAHANNSHLYSDAEVFLEELKKRRIPLILMTSSDSVMKTNDDLTLTYDPDFSGAYKMKRISILPIEYSSIILGETVDKPNPKFFELVYADLNKLGSFERNSVLFIGDSPKSDLMVPEKDRFNTLLIKR